MPHNDVRLPPLSSVALFASNCDWDKHDTNIEQMYPGAGGG